MASSLIITPRSEAVEIPKYESPYAVSSQCLQKNLCTISGRFHVTWICIKTGNDVSAVLVTKWRHRKINVANSKIGIHTCYRNVTKKVSLSFIVFELIVFFAEENPNFGVYPFTNKFSPRPSKDTFLHQTICIFATFLLTCRLVEEENELKTLLSPSPL